MIKTLYISDLDGTLLNSKMEISEFSVNKLNELISKGLNFTIATARTSATALHLLNEVNLNLPIILMNGVCVFDFVNKKFIKVEKIQKSSIENLFNILKKYNKTGFLYTINDDKLLTYYERLETKHQTDFYKQRVEQFGKKFIKVESFFECVDNNNVYFSVADTKENLNNIYFELKNDKYLNVEFYRDIYNQDFWYLEVCSSTASKYSAVKFLKESLQFDKVVCFGDNLNDLSMFRASDECYAVSNAKEQVKDAANDVIESNNDDGVVKFLLSQNDQFI